MTTKNVYFSYRNLVTTYFDWNRPSSSDTEYQNRRISLNSHFSIFALVVVVVKRARGSMMDPNDT